MLRPGGATFLLQLPRVSSTPKFGRHTAKVVSLVRFGRVTVGHCIALGLIFLGFERRGQVLFSPEFMERRSNDPAWAGRGQRWAPAGLRLSWAGGAG